MKRSPALALRFTEPGGRIVYIGLSRRASLVDSREIALNDITAVGILGASGRSPQRPPSSTTRADG